MKKALLIGINYIGSQNQLNGCINDISHINTFLTMNCSYQGINIKKLTDDQTQIQNKPTRANIEANIKWLVANAKSGDVLFFYYSGHGSQIQDVSKDEIDKLDEVIVPVDFEKAGIITDDYLYQNLAQCLPAGVTLWAFTDCCHSGTIFDLKYNVQCNSTYTKGNINTTMLFNASDWTNKFTFSNENSRDTVADVYMFSGCLDQDVSADTYEMNQYQGAFSFCFLQSVQTNLKRMPDGSTQFLGTKKICDLLKEIDCRLIIHNYKQRSQLSLGSIKDLEKTFTP